ncbi:MAG: dipeptidase [Syntrophomonas sp.]|uniref:dipeptidase n=1 Tax=Syntrophomonas sp. TaxID=2053627 RepID=UPI002614D7D1|nr:dipeptidase [Syntrophomonas sp.]MDD2509709.1 dipeptidase [Syntrophomonas sp.]MDD3879406.1 dipeptidase [Syntrophomonas sp.]MDD4625841.1 dipeptidase [Syntrophomonas sp.]
MQIVDLHCDTISEITVRNEALLNNRRHFDLERAKKAGICLQIFALFSSSREADSSLREILIQIDKFYHELEQNYLRVFQILGSNELQKVGQTDKIACLLHLEGAEAIGTDLAVFRQLCRMGLRSIGLTWNYSNQLAGGIAEGGNAGGLTRYGKDIIKEIERSGILLDLSHISEQAFFEALDYYNLPVMVTHANARAICNHPRNLSDEQLKVLAENGAVIGLNQVAHFVKEGKATLEDFLNHAVYISDLIGVKHLALGSDFDGTDSLVLPGVEAYATLEQGLHDRGFLPQEVEMILQRNALRVMKRVLNAI